MWPRLALPAGAALFVLAALLLLTVARSSEAQTADNLVWVDPSGVEVAPNGRFTVRVIANPPPESLTAWVIDVSFDPEVVSTTSPDCLGLQQPPGGVGAFLCQAVDSGTDGVVDTVKVIGAVYFGGTEQGLTARSTLATITFRVEGGFGDCTDLRLRTIIHADKVGQETNPLVQDGSVCVQQGAPASGTAVPNPVSPRTSEPTPPGTPVGPGPGITVPPDDGGEPGQTLPGGHTAPGTGPNGDPGATGLTAAPGETLPATPVLTDAQGRPIVGGNGGDGGNGGTVLWIIAGVLALAAAASGAWALIRLRGAREGAPPTGAS